MAKAVNITTNVTDSEWETLVEPYGESWDFKNDPVLQGIYRSRKVVHFTDKKTGEIRDSNVYEIQNESGKWSLWGSYNIDAAFAPDTENALPFGCEVRVKFEGQSDTSDGQRVNKFTVQVRRP